MKDGTKEIANFLKEEIRDLGSVKICFVCTHNSRRSQFAQAWMTVLSTQNRLPIKVFSAGTEQTACNPRTIESLKRNGFNLISTKGDSTNPVYCLNWSGVGVELFSKIISDVESDKPYLAVMTCNDADENCPYIPEAKKRITFTFIDPKHSDDTPIEEETYDETCLEIKTEIEQIINLITNEKAELS